MVKRNMTNYVKIYIPSIDRCVSILTVWSNSFVFHQAHLVCQTALEIRPQVLSVPFWKGHGYREFFLHQDSSLCFRRSQMAYWACLYCKKINQSIKAYFYDYCRFGLTVLGQTHANFILFVNNGALIVHGRPFQQNGWIAWSRRPGISNSWSFF